jgi:hypothetical protein
MNRIEECARDVISICHGGDGAACEKARQRIKNNRFFDDLAAHLRDNPRRDGTRHIGDLEDLLTTASTDTATGRRAEALSNCLRRCIDHVSRRKEGWLFGRPPSV